MAQNEISLVGDRLFADVEKYVEFGVHRTATRGDRQTGKWLSERLRNAGLDVQEQAWQFRRFELEQCFVRLGKESRESFPFWFPRATGNSGVTARLVPYRPGDLSHSKGCITFFSSEFLLDYFTKNQWRTSKAQDLIVKVANHGAVGAVFAIPQSGGEILAVNASTPFSERPLPIPSVILATKHEAIVQRAIQADEPLTIVIRGRTHGNERAANVIGTLRRGNKWLIVSTPSSGWFQCGGERGAGIALWLALAEWSARRDSKLSCIFVANSGHELDYKGAEHLHRAGLLPTPEETRCWLHLGASIGNRLWQRTDDGFVPTEQMNDEHLVGSENLVPLLQKEFQNVLGFRPRGGETRGELTAILRAGYTGFGFYGGHQWFHTALDTPQSTGPRRLQAIFAACTAVLAHLELHDRPAVP